MNTFFVTSPLQLINAAEAQSYFGTKDNTLIVLRNTTQGFPLSMMKRVVREDEWDRVYYFATYDNEHITELGKLYWFYLRQKMRLRLVRLATALGQNNGLFIGNYYDPLAYYFSRALPHHKLYLIDDGTATLEVNDNRHHAANIGSSPLNFLTREYASRAEDNWAKELIFFSVYNFAPRSGDTYVPNRYKFFRNRVGKAKTGDEVWFLGTPLSSTGYLNEDTHLRYLKVVRSYYKNRPFVYLPHSREPKEVVDRISKVLECEVRRYGLPVEHVLAEAKPRPQEMATFISSALTNCHILFGDTLKLTAFRLKSEQLIGWHALVESIYRHFEQEADPNFQVVEIEAD